MVDENTVLSNIQADMALIDVNADIQRNILKKINTAPVRREPYLQQNKVIVISSDMLRDIQQDIKLIEPDMDKRNYYARLKRGKYKHAYDVDYYKRKKSKP